MFKLLGMRAQAQQVPLWEGRQSQREAGCLGTGRRAASLLPLRGDGGEVGSGESSRPCLTVSAETF